MTRNRGERTAGEEGVDADRMLVMDREDVERLLSSLAEEIAERTSGEGADGAEDLILVGIRRRGVQLARRIARHLEESLGRQIPTGSLDITLYRDDFAQVGPRPLIGPTEIPGEITGKRVVVVDDVLHTGRTVRAALDELADFGRPRRIELCVLVDRGGRELPIQPDYVGREVGVEPGREVAVSVPDLDGDLSVYTVPV